MSTARHHAEWLSLVEASGPFVSMPVLLKAFPQGLDAHDSEVMRQVRLAHDEWQDNQLSTAPDAGIHGAWVEFVLREVLGFPDQVLLSGQEIPSGLAVTVAEQGETLRPDWVVGQTAKGSAVRMLVQMYGPGQNLDRAVRGSRWAASAATRMMELLHGCDVRLGLVTNGEHWLLVNAPKGETTGYISWYATLWQEEPLTLRAFRALLGVERFFGVDESETIEALLAESVNSQQEVTDQLGFQVREAVEVLVQSIDRVDQDRHRELLAGVSEGRLYEAALTVMMRLVFLFSAEERGLLLLGDPVYDQFYAVSTLREMLREQADQSGEEILERRQDAWCRLLAVFRAVYGGIGHEALRLPAYGGTLFDPDRFAFLEGRAEGSNWQAVMAEPIAINNRTVLHLLEALQILQVRLPGGGGVEPRKLSFRALDIEQIGHVYEGLLDHTAVRSQEPILGLVGTKDKEPEVALAELAGFDCAQSSGEEALLTFLKKVTGRSLSALKKALAETGGTPIARERLRAACGNDEGLFERVLPFAGLIRLDTFGYPVVIAGGSVYVTQGSDRRDTGTHYTPRSLTEEIVKYTLQPLVYKGVAEGKPKEKWRLKGAPALLSLKVCDMAMGSGAFLVEVCRYLSARLVEAWESAEEKLSDGPHPSPLPEGEGTGGIRVLPDGSLSTGDANERLLPADAEERLIMARRLVADRCLYGVDKNPLAVEMAKLSLWLITLQKNKPFTFLDHALRCGDSLVGVSVEQLWHWNMDTHETTPELLASDIRAQLGEVAELRRQLEAVSVETTADQVHKQNLLGQAQTRMTGLQLGADLLVTSYFRSSKKARQEDARQVMLSAYRGECDVPVELQDVLEKADVRPFHWELEFPEVFAAGGGFDAIVGNPPFQGGSKITGALGTDYRNFLVDWIAEGKKGNADLCAYFFLKADQSLRVGGDMGLVATNTIAQGDTREVGLDQLTAKGRKISRAVPSRKWPGNANLEVAYVWLSKGAWGQDYTLNAKPVSGITSFLTEPGKIVGNPYKLAANQGKSFTGNKVYGEGFVLTPTEVNQLIQENPRNSDVLFPYLNGQDLNTNPDQSPSRWVINFGEASLEQAMFYPDCLEIVERLVKPYRETVKRAHTREKWWQHEHTRKELYSVIKEYGRVLARSRVANIHSMCFVPADIVLNDRLAVFAFEKDKEFSLLQSDIHESWARRYSSTLRTDMMYAPSDCFETFPFPTNYNNLKSIGTRYYTHRQSIMHTTQQGLTKTYNRFHTPEDTAPDIATLRTLHIEMDTAVAAAYGWQDLTLDHGFHETKQGLRFTISEAARREVLDRLLALNHERYAEEVKQGLHDKKKKGKKTKPKAKKVTPQKEAPPEDQMKLFF
ncbi:MAG: DNA methyltransferase [Phormidesmis sp.]